MEFSKPHMLVTFILLFFSLVSSARVNRSGPSPGLSPDLPFPLNIADGKKSPLGPNPRKSPGESPATIHTEKFQVHWKKPPLELNPEKSPYEPPAKTENSRFSTIYRSLWEIKRLVPSGPNQQQPPEAPSRF
ncbi:hypothetical protein MANES_18G104132v8 [Manihot esculenta]|uniref:Uncharacterized protein n=1 Tax=Manihot esculenta TaxID=3983 RepID=A0ACB7G0Y1_MANES|nr:hypothetical protein MANES_18G104132v8 [Manihot esculenta]